MNTAIFIMSCDNTRDILNHFIKGFNLYWKNNKLQIYLGCNQSEHRLNFSHTILLSTPKFNWKEETLNQLFQIKKHNNDIKHLLIILDDFIFNKHVNNSALLELIKYVENENIKYLRLKKLEDSFIYKLLQYFNTIKICKNIKIFKIRNSHPYYSSLQIAIWDIDYLISIINSIDNIWEFELQHKSPNSHYSVMQNIFYYKHVVEKGKWESYAKSYCKKNINYFIKGNREVHKITFQDKFIKTLKRIKFFFFGYLFSSKFIIK